jgi:hypothetical protein
MRCDFYFGGAVNWQNFGVSVMVFSFWQRIFVDWMIPKVVVWCAILGLYLFQDSTAANCKHVQKCWLSNWSHVLTAYLLIDSSTCGSRKIELCCILLLLLVCGGWSITRAMDWPYRPHWMDHEIERYHNFILFLWGYLEAKVMTTIHILLMKWSMQLLKGVLISPKNSGVTFSFSVNNFNIYKYCIAE